MSPPASAPDLVVLSHLRWNFVYQRPQHLLSRAARNRRVFFVEEPVPDGGPARFEAQQHGNVTVLRPHLGEHQPELCRELLLEHLEREGVRDPVLWFYTPMALPLTEGLGRSLVVYDCMDELANFKGAPPALRERERELFNMADVVFTGGHSLYEAKKHVHHNVHPVPSSVDCPHFARARVAMDEPADQAGIPRPRVGFFGVIDERLDIALVDGLAALRPDLQLVMIGPVVKIDPASLPQRPNIHWLGGKSYDELPSYLAGWDVAMLPFARNESTRFISPTKTPEYLAAGKQVVSTAITDVIRPYGREGLVRIANEPEDFSRAIDEAMAEPREAWLESVDRMLAQMSWDDTWNRMESLMEHARVSRVQAELNLGVG